MPNIGHLIIATGKYTDFLQQLITSADKYLLPERNVTYVIFSDQETNVETERSVLSVKIDHKPWPHSTIMRYQFFADFNVPLSWFDYLIYTDCDCRFVDYVGEEILKDLVAVVHPGYYSGGGSWENNKNSMAYVPKKYRRQYVCGGVQAGKRYLEFAMLLAERIKSDLSKGIMPIFHDESHWNALYSFYPELFTILPPSYCYVDNAAKARAWGIDHFEPKILALEKDHKQYQK